MIKYDDYLDKCIICSSKNIYKYHYSSGGQVIFKCGSCKVQFMNPQYSDEYLQDMYSHYINEEPEYYQAIDQSHLDCLLMIEKFCPDKGALLDIGSGNGNLIYWAKQRGWKVEGYDVDPETVKRISSNVNVPMFTGKFENLPLKENSYDVVSIIHVLEHLKNPVSYIQVIKRILKTGGVLFIALPNVQSRSGNFKFLLEKLKIKKVNIAGHYDTGHHLTYFTPKTIRNTLGLYGFKVKLIYSGREAEVPFSRLTGFMKERISSKVSWPSNMSLIAVNLSK